MEQKRERKGGGKMKHFKFRVWDILGRRMLEWGDVFNLPAWEIFPGTPEQRPYDVLQFTGATDQEGKEVYEGDIVEKEVGGKKEKYLVIWLGKYTRFTFWQPGIVFASGLIAGGNFVKIGDIYTTPEHWKEYGGWECWKNINAHGTDEQEAEE